MNKANLKSYAPKARLDFIKAVTERANVLGISAAGAALAEVRGDVAIIDGREWSAKVARQRDELIARIKRHGFEQTMDEVAYTWFNRFAALRYMEIHDYLDHGWRVLSSRDGGLPEILRHASEVTLPGLNSDRAREMQLAGKQDNELYKLLLVAQCNELSRVMPFLFERIDDETELLLPENLLRTDSIVAKLVESVPEDDWQEIEVIGWLYQFYISEKKDQVIGKMVKSEDIPAATQLFTPNWIVQYLVQNSVGRLWLMANPDSTLASQWPYYIQPAEQTPEVQAQLDALIQTRIREDGETLNPETITVLDPACGSGHILVVAYDVLKAIYLERGYQHRSIPRLILEKNLYGLDIDDRAGQLAAFALLMKARADDRRLFNDPPKLNVLSLQESNGLAIHELVTHLAPFGLERGSLKALIDTFERAKTFGSLIQISAGLSGQLTSMAECMRLALQDGDLYAQQAAKDVLPFVRQALLMGMKVDTLVANPPYMGSKGMTTALKDFARRSFPGAQGDLSTCFVERSYSLVKSSGFAALVTLQGWMFGSLPEQMRERLLREKCIFALTQIGFNSFPSMNSKVALAAAFVFGNYSSQEFVGAYVDLNSAPESADKNELFLRQTRSDYYFISGNDLLKIPGSRLAYWASPAARRAIEQGKPLGGMAKPRIGMRTGDDERFVRYWHEVSSEKLGTGASSAEKAKWFPFLKGGDFRKWYGNLDCVVNWEGGGEEIKAATLDAYPELTPEKLGWKISNEEFYFQECLTWSDISLLETFGARYCEPGAIISTLGSGIYASKAELNFLLALINSKATKVWLRIINPSLHANPGDIAELPLADVSEADMQTIDRNSRRCISLGAEDWKMFERSMDFQRHAILNATLLRTTSTISASYHAWLLERDAVIAEMRRLEEENNRIIISAYDLADELSPEVVSEQVTLTVNPPYRYGGKSNSDDHAARYRKDTAEELISYAIGCMVGRYSLDEPGLIYAHAGNVGFDPSRYEKQFPADADGIVALTNERWFEGDAASRVHEFLLACWGADTLEENIAWLAESVGARGSETPDETVRRYFADKFFKNHLQAYKKRPIYWLFSSGKHGAFQALVYVHRYNEGTLARMRTGYVVPLIGKVASRLEMLEKDVAAASSAAARTRLQKKIESLKKKQVELLAYDEKLRHYADMRITLDLDDGVKVNYAKFGDLVAEAKAIAGGSDE